MIVYEYLFYNLLKELFISYSFFYTISNSVSVHFFYHFIKYIVRKVLYHTNENKEYMEYYLKKNLLSVQFFLVQYVYTMTCLKNVFRRRSLHIHFFHVILGVGTPSVFSFDVLHSYTYIFYYHTCILVEVVLFPHSLSIVILSCYMC